MLSLFRSAVESVSLQDRYEQIVAQRSVLQTDCQKAIDAHRASIAKSNAEIETISNILVLA